MGAVMRAQERDVRSAGSKAPAPEATPRIDSAALLKGARRLLIEHDGEVYTLHLTRQNKLLLTK
ncbi:MAG: hemin uptake protein HemP [Rubrimonas sp.]